ncbi:MAG: hypothetical protein ABI134_35295, partial [Byssovorax sp.]
PKCPLCLAAYLGITGSIAAGSWLPPVWGLPIGAALLAWALGALVLRARRSRDYRPPLVGLAGAAALLGGKLAVDSAPLLYAGAALVMGASIWSVRRVRPGAHGGERGLVGLTLAREEISPPGTRRRNVEQNHPMKERA